MLTNCSINAVIILVVWVASIIVGSMKIALGLLSIWRNRVHTVLVVTLRHLS